MARGGRAAPWRGRWLALVGLGKALGGAASQDHLWTVECNADCGGVDTCAERGLCVGEVKEEKICPDNPRCPASESKGRCVPQDCTWGSWSQWTNDGVSGLCSRHRGFQPNRCGGHPCLGSLQQTMYCEPDRDPPQDCVFNPWGPWGSCDETTLQRKRERSVKVPGTNGGSPCKGSLVETQACGDREQPVDCELTEWMPWSGCTRSCGGGQQQRIRAVLTQAAYGGDLCRGESGGAVVLQITRACNSWECDSNADAINCQVGPWSAWSDCTGDESVRSEWEARGVSATKTQKFRKREIASPASEGGLPCEDKLEETAPCHDFDLLNREVTAKQDCQLSQWASWTLCDRTCEGGQTYRKRTIEAPPVNGGEPCEDLMSETMPCNDIPCTVNAEGVDCLLSQWTPWSECSAQCGQGIEQRNRQILVPATEGGKGCNDILDETRPCEHWEPCPHTDCAWSLWTQWSTCSRTCSGGQRTRFRYVAEQPSAGGKPCDAHDSISEVEACAEEACPEDCIDGKWSEWSPWDACSKSCGGGLQWRHRRIVQQASSCGKAVSGVAEELQPCGTEACQGDKDCEFGAWSMWSSCSQSCNGVQSRSRTVTNHATGSGKPCAEGNEGVALNEVRSCNAPNELLLQAQAPGFADIIEECGYGEPVDCELDKWSEWSDCSAACGGGDRTRKRSVLQRPRNGGQPCSGPLEEVGVCNNVPCEEPKDCEWGEWGPWGNCSQCDGEKTRTREIAERGNAMGKPCEAGASKEVAQCNNCEKVKTYWCIWAEWTAGACSASCGPGLLKKTRELLKTEKVPEDPSDALGKVVGEHGTCDGKETSYAKCTDQPVCADGCHPQDCEFSAWSPWSEASCNGICRRHRMIEQQANECGKPCEGLLETTKACEAHCDGTADCELSAWSLWSDCQDSGEQRWRDRRILAVPGPFGKPCEGDLQETKPCEDEAPQMEVVDCMFSPWGAWTECSASCGGGQHERERSFATHATPGGEVCKGPLSETAPCGAGDCAMDTQNVDCVIGPWSGWTGCDGSSSLQAFRTRSITPAVGMGLPCEGAIKESGDCPKPEPLDCTFEDWAPWGTCGRSCGGGQRFRTRQVKAEAQHDGKPCEGFLDQTEPCNEIPCSPDMDCAVTDWTAWSECDIKCGTGVQTRERKILRGASPGGVGCGMGLKQVQGCQGSDCLGDQDCVWGEWQEWGGCEKAEFCGMGVRRRIREIAVYPQGSGKLCDTLSSEEVMPSALCMGECDQQTCINGEWGEWGPFGACSVTCGGGGVRMQSRWEKTQANYCGVAAEGDRQRFELCSADIPCPSHDELDCGFMPWGPWESECSSWCNGIRTRSRQYTLPTSGGKACSGATMESVRCNPGKGELPPSGCESGEPVDCEQSPWEPWSACSAKCGIGHKTRRRQVIQPPSFGGRECENPLEEIGECYADMPCPDTSMDCEMGEWEAWSECDPIKGQRVRERHVKRPKVGMGKDCANATKEVGACERTCEDRTYFCLWSEWTPWSACSTTCGGEGRISRKRLLTVSPVPPEGQQAFDEDVPVQAKFEELQGALATASLQRHRELSLAFVAGLMSLAAMVVGGRRLARHLGTPGAAQGAAAPGPIGSSSGSREPLTGAGASGPSLESRRIDLELQS